MASEFNKILVQGKYSRKIKIELSSENAGLKAINYDSGMEQRVIKNLAQNKAFVEKRQEENP